MANEDTPEPSLATVGLNASHELHMTTLPVLVTWLAHKCTCVGVDYAQQIWAVEMPFGIKCHE